MNERLLRALIRCRQWNVDETLKECVGAWCVAADAERNRSEARRRRDELLVEMRVRMQRNVVLTVESMAQRRIAANELSDAYEMAHERYIQAQRIAEDVDRSLRAKSAEKSVLERILKREQRKRLQELARKRQKSDDEMWLTRRR